MKLRCVPAVLATLVTYGDPPAYLEPVARLVSTTSGLAEVVAG